MSGEQVAYFVQYTLFWHVRKWIEPAKFSGDVAKQRDLYG